MDDIARKWDRLSLNQRESQIVPLTPDVTGDGKVGGGNEGEWRGVE